MVLDIFLLMLGLKLINLWLVFMEFIDLMLKDDNVDYILINLIFFGGIVNIGVSLFVRYVNLLGGSMIINFN